MSADFVRKVFSGTNIMEALVKAIWLLIAGAFVIGGWVTSIQFTQNSHTNAISTNQAEIHEVKDKYQKNQDKLVDFMGRVDERLKVIEKRR